MSVKVSLKLIEVLKPSWFLCCTKDGEVRIVKDAFRKLREVGAPGSTIFLFRPETLEMGSFQYLQSEMVSHCLKKFPTKAVKEEDLQKLRDRFMMQLRDATLRSLKRSDQQVVFQVVKMFPAKETLYGFTVPMKIADQDGNIGMINIYKDAWRFEEGGIYRVIGLQRRNPDVAWFITTPSTKVLELSEEEASAIIFPRLGEKEMKGVLLFTFDVSNKEICRAHRHPINSCVYCKKSPQMMSIPSTWEMTATCIVQLTAAPDYGYAEERKIYLDGPSLFGRKPGEVVSFIEGIKSAASRKEGKMVKIQFNTFYGHSYAHKMEIMEEEED